MSDTYEEKKDKRRDCRRYKSYLNKPTSFGTTKRFPYPEQIQNYDVPTFNKYVFSTPTFNKNCNMNSSNITLDSNINWNLYNNPQWQKRVAFGTQSFKNISLPIEKNGYSESLWVQDCHRKYNYGIPMNRKKLNISSTHNLGPGSYFPTNKLLENKLNIHNNNTSGCLHHLKDNYLAQSTMHLTPNTSNSSLLNSLTIPNHFNNTNNSRRPRTTPLMSSKLYKVKYDNYAIQSYANTDKYGNRLHYINRSFNKHYN